MIISARLGSAEKKKVSIDDRESSVGTEHREETSWEVSESLPWQTEQASKVASIDDGKLSVGTKVHKATLLGMSESLPPEAREALQDGFSTFDNREF